MTILDRHPAVEGTATGNTEVLFPEARRRAVHRRIRVAVAVLVVAGVATVAGVAGITGGNGATGNAVNSPLLASSSNGVLATTGGVVWSFSLENGSGVVLRSSDDGEHWAIVLPGQTSGSGLGLVASFFLGPRYAWAAQEDQDGATSVYRTSDSGRHWTRVALPEVLLPSQPVLFDQLYFANPSDGWLLGVGGFGSLTAVWWQTENGGRTWRSLPAETLPAQGLTLPAYGLTACPVFSMPHLAFASLEQGWLTDGACAHGVARPVVWRTNDGGEVWSAFPLPAPAGGWGDWDVLDHGGTDVGAPTVMSASGRTLVLVPVAVGRSRLVIERSVDGGKTWQIAGSTDTKALPLQSTPAEWFDPIDAAEWVVAAPGGLIETRNGGRSWTFTRTPLTATGQPASFTSPTYGFLEGTSPEEGANYSPSGLVIAERTMDVGRTWAPESIALSRSETAAWSPGAPISSVEFVSPRLAVVAGPAGLFTSSDKGRTWVERLGVTYPVSQLDFLNGRVGFAVAEGELLRTMDGGVHWRAVPHPDAGGVSNVDFSSLSAGVATVGETLFVTENAGRSWTTLRLPRGWTLPETGASAVCLASHGVGWAVGDRGSEVAVFVTTNGGDEWRAALSPRFFPFGGQPGKPGASLSISACRGDAMWLSVAQAAGVMSTLGLPETFDLVRTLNLGRSWLDVLRWPSETKVTRPHVATPIGGPQIAPAYSVPASLSLISATTAWLTARNPYSGGITFASTGDDGIHWAIHSFPGGDAELAPTRFKLPEDNEWFATTALGGQSAWVLYAGRNAKSNSYTNSYLYETSDAGATWHRLAAFAYS